LDNTEKQETRDGLDTVNSKRSLSFAWPLTVEGKKKIIDVRAFSLKKWLDLLNSAKSDELFVNWQFPSNEMRDEYLQTIHDRNEEEVVSLLRRFLLTSGSLGTDDFAIRYLLHCMKYDRAAFEDMMRTERYKRLLRGYFNKKVAIWEGNTWVIDLLPFYPKLALDVLHAYLTAHFQFLPDGRIEGLLDAMSLIRAKFIETPPSALISGLNPYQFEHLVDSLYSCMGYKTNLTQRTYDGGRDIIAQKKDPGERERLLIQCRIAKKNIGVDEIRALLGVVSNEKATKGVFVASSEFTREAKKLEGENARLELIGKESLHRLLNQYFGPGWHEHIDRIISSSMSKKRTNTPTGESY